MPTPERMQLVERLFHAALELDASERSAYLTAACGADASLRREVDDLLAAHGDSSGFLNSPPSVLGGTRSSRAGADLETGRVIGPYRVISLLGRGGMGDVYLVDDAKLRRQVALKIFSPALVHDEHRLKRFRQEACAASGLNHPNILTVHDFGEADGFHFIATEYVEGETLRQLIAREPLGFAAVLDIAIQAAAGLSAAHAAGIVHRDIKPENIMIRPDGLVKLLDFGLAKLTEEGDRGGESDAGSFAQTIPGTLMGTVGYMSPEQARGVEVDGRGDVFSLGVVMYELLTRNRPFAGETPSHVIVAILEQEPRALHEYPVEAPIEFRWMLGKALRKPADERYQSAKDLLVDLRQLKRDRESADAVDRAVPKPADAAVARAITPGEPPRRAAGAIAGALRRPAIAIGAALMAIALASAGYVWVRPVYRGSLSSTPVRPAHWWTFDESGGAAIDSGVSATRVDGVLGAAVKRTAGRRAGACGVDGGAIELTGAKDSYVDFGANVGQFGKQDFTIGLWLKTAFREFGRNKEILSTRSVGTHGSYLSVRQENSVKIGQVWFAAGEGVTAAGSGINFLSAGSAPESVGDGQWHQVVVLREGVAAKVFIDGRRDVASETSMKNGDMRVGDGVTVLSNGSPLLLGSSLYVESGEADAVIGRFEGVIDDVRIYDRALSDEQVSRLFGGLTVVIGECNSNVINKVLANSCTINERIARCREQATSASPFGTCVGRVTTELVTAGTITQQEARTIQQCVR